MAIIGKNILESLTTGMYSDSKVIYREYIQNACDQIDIAIKQGIDKAENFEVNIYLDPGERWISIEDNATGVQSESFQAQLGNIADSDKKIGESKGFRGIGRLCGLAYCKTLKFVTSYQGEHVKSIMEIDAAKMRQMLDEDKKYPLDDILDAIVQFWQEPEEIEEHYFHVLLKDINKSNTDLLSYEKVAAYLSFIAPVPYSSKFTLRSNIMEHAKTLNYRIEEYRIKINGKDVVKNYSCRLYEGQENNKKEYDYINKLAFKEIYDDNNNLIAWLWYGLSRFEKSIPTTLNPMRGLRLRKHNIQVGSSNVVSGLFKEGRGNGYFVGEIFAVSRDLIPNSQRDYFNENDARIIFENGLSDFFYHDLHTLYTSANKIKNSYEKEVKYEQAVKNYEEQEEKGFIDDNQKAKLKAAVIEAEKKKVEAQRYLDKIKENKEDTPINVVKTSIIREYERKLAVQQKSGGNETKERENKDKSEEKKKPKQVYFTDSLSKLNKSDRKLVSKILSIVNKHVSEEVAKQIQENIKKEFG